jgi:hypothetical protein
MSRLYGLHPWHLRALTAAELDSYRADLFGRGQEGAPGG